jgi:hypothetical protein
MGISEVVFIVGFFGLMIGCWFLMKGVAKVFWLSTFSALVGVIAIAEIVGVSTQQHTISQMFWEWSVANQGKAWLILGMLTVAFGLLIWHLAAKLISKKD